MTLLYILLGSLAVLCAVLTAWLSISIFGIRKRKLLMAVWAGIGLSLASIGCFFISDVASVAVSIIVGIALSIIIWAIVLKRLAPDKYSIKRVIGIFFLSTAFQMVFAPIFALAIIATVAQVYQISGDSMEPAYRNGDKVLIYKFDKTPSRDEVIVYRLDTGAKAFGRVKATAGETVVAPNGAVDVDGQMKSISNYQIGAKQYYVISDSAAYNIPPRIVNEEKIVGKIGRDL